MSRAKGVAKLAGGVACVVCVGWIVHRIASADVVARFTTAPDAGRWWIQIAGGAVLYAAAALLLGVGWYALLRAFGVSGVPVSSTLTIYSVSQFGKYVPGSVLQYLGRHAMSRAHDVSHRLLVLCTLRPAEVSV